MKKNIIEKYLNLLAHYGVDAEVEQDIRTSDPATSADIIRDLIADGVLPYSFEELAAIYDCMK